MSARFYEFGPFRVDTANHVLLRNGEPLPLKPKVFDTLLVLVESRGRVLDKDELMSRLWPDTVVEEANLTQNIYLLRKALGEESHGGAYIETMPKRGYQFVASVRVLEAGSPALAPEESAAAEGERRQPAGSGGGEAGPAFLFGRRRAATLALAALALAAAFVFVPIPKRPEQAAPPSIRSMAVLPFKPLGPDADDESLGFGMADTLITRLSNIRQLAVRPTGAVRRFASPDQDPVAAGRELKVDAVLEASIQRAGDRIRVTLRLVRVSDGAPLWAGKFDEPAGDVLAVQDRVSEQVAQALVPRMTGEEQRLVAKRYTENPEAYRLYMLGRRHWSQTKAADWDKAIEYFQRAIETDPNYALAHAGLADTYMSLVADSLLAKKEAVPRARQAATTALRLDDTLAEAHVALGRIKSYYDWDWAGAEQEFVRAVELNPNSGDARREYAAYLTNTGRSEAAIAEAKLARELDPLTQVTNFQFVWALVSARRYDEAVEESRAVVDLFPHARFWIGMAYLGKGMNEQAAAEFEQTLIHSKDHLMAQSSLGYAYAASGRRDKAERVLAELRELFEQRRASPYYVAMVYAGLGERDNAFAWLEEAYRERSRLLVSGLKVNPMWDGIRSDPRFADLLRRMGLPQ